MALTVGTNSYISVADADVYFSERLHSANWTNAEDTDKEASLIQATRMLDNLFTWVGTITDPDQSLDWPRTGVYDENGRLIESDVIPVQIEQATC
jgi:hypothetical protein